MDATVGDQPAQAMVFTPSPLLTITIEAVPDGSADTHLHAGGQGVWIARLMARLGARVRLCGPFGGEAGAVLRTLVEREGVSLRPSDATSNGAYVHDRRGGEREAIAVTPPPPLKRHQLDELFNGALVEGLDATIAVLAGPDGEDLLSADTYHRLTADLISAGVTVVADLSGDFLIAAAEGGVSVLKVSHEDLIDHGHSRSDSQEDLMAAMTELAGRGAGTVVVSRAGDPALMLSGGRFAEVRMPVFHGLDHRGAGDSMTGGLAAGLTRGADLEAALRLGAAAGALNSTRHGLATGERDLIERLAGRVDIHPLDREPAG